jgi:hypothetical protein
MLKNIIKKYIYKITAPNHTKISQNIDELLWASIYHDTIRGNEWAKNISISPYDMAINYSMLYLITRILSEFKVKRILEFGLGQSSKFINAYVESDPKNISHDIIEHNTEWINFFRQNILSSSKILNLKLEVELINNKKIQIFSNLLDYIQPSYELYIIDGPNGLSSNSRFDINKIAERFLSNEQFVIIMDDYQRKGEQETMNTLMSILQSKGITFHHKVFKGSKSQMMIVSDKYKYATSF